MYAIRQYEQHQRNKAMTRFGSSRTKHGSSVCRRTRHLCCASPLAMDCVRLVPCWTADRQEGRGSQPPALPRSWLQPRRKHSSKFIHLSSLHVLSAFYKFLGCQRTRAATDLVHCCQSDLFSELTNEPQQEVGAASRSYSVISKAFFILSCQPPTHPLDATLL